MKCNFGFERSGLPGKPPLPQGLLVSVADRMLAVFRLSRGVALIGLFLSSITSHAQPANDRFTRAQRIVGLAGTVSGSNLNATQQPGEPIHATTGSGYSIWYRWAPPYPVKITFSTEGSAFDTVIAVYTGNALTALTWVADNDNSSVTETFSRCSFVAAAGTDYIVAIDGVGSAQGDVALKWNASLLNDNFEDFFPLNGVAGSVTGTTMGATLEQNEVPPLDNNVGATAWFSWPSILAGTVTFSAVGSGFNTVLAVYTGTTLDGLTLVAVSDNGSENPMSEVTWDAELGARYRVVLAGGSAATGEYTLSWNQVLPPPLNDSFDTAVALVGFTGQKEGFNGGATTEPGEPPHAANASGSSVWYSWIAPRDGRAHFSTSRSLFPTVVAFYTGERVDALTVVARSDDGPPSTAAEVDVITQKGNQYWLALDGQHGARGLFLLQWTYSDLKTPNNSLTNAQSIQGFMGTALGENYYADTEPGEPYHAGDQGGRSIWYRWIAPANFRVAFKTKGSNFDTLLAVYTGLDFVSGLTLIAANDDDPNSGLTSAVNFEAVGGTPYHIAVDAATDRGINSPSIGMVSLNWEPGLSDFIGFLPNQGATGSFIKVCGLNLADAQSLSFGDLPSNFFFQNGYLVAEVPEGATTGPINVVDSGGNLRTTTENFILLPGLPPQLSLQRLNATTIRLSWPSQITGYQLQSCPDLSDDGWRAEEPPTKMGGEWVVDEDYHSEKGSHYYRLVRQ